MRNGEGRIRTSEGIAARFTVWSLWPLGNLPTHFNLPPGGERKSIGRQTSTTTRPPRKAPSRFLASVPRTVAALGVNSGGNAKMAASTAAPATDDSDLDDFSLVLGGPLYHLY